MPAATITLTDAPKLGEAAKIKQFIQNDLIAELLVILQDFEDRIYALENPA